MTSLNIDWKPIVGMEFNSIEETYQFWLAYSAHVGFRVRKRYANKNKDDTISSCRTDCKARISLGCHNEKFVINEFVKDHNHPLQPPKTTHMLTLHRRITEVQAYEIDMANDSRLR
ncbi:unnamed protein product [Vicia faba]|uniref:FAR1 domain-containing protein n=1 Tax=Vicia faba TaxID=3906 RepID=A0AAV0ZA69_VICFA|nr:unnamed protein product [Vicia faba]